MNIGALLIHHLASDESAIFKIGSSFPDAMASGHLIFGDLCLCTAQVLARIIRSKAIEEAQEGAEKCAVRRGLDGAMATLCIGPVFQIQPKDLRVVVGGYCFFYCCLGG